MIVTARTFRDLPLRGVPVLVRRSRSGRRVSVIMGPDEPMTVMEGEGAGLFGVRWPRTGRKYAMYANTGLEPLLRSVRWPFAFYDVDNPDAVLAAIDRARTLSTW